MGTEDAEEGEIKRAYRKLSKDLHPDKNPSPEARQQFNEVRDAYEILSSPESKILYDTGGMEAIQEHKKGQVQKGETSQNSVAVTLEMLYTGAVHPVSERGTHGKSAYGARVCRPAAGRDQKQPEV